MPDIAIAAKRYDNANGLATFTGCVPLKPGQLWETDDGTASGVKIVPKSRLINSAHLRNAADTAQIDAHISALYPQHKDGSIKSLRISAALTLNNLTQLDMILRVGSPQVGGGGPTSHPVVNQASLTFPRLIGCTNTQHLCDSRACPWPLVPVNHANLVNTPFAAFLTTELEDGHTGLVGGQPNMEPAMSSAAYPTYKIILHHLATYGSLNRYKLCTVTQGSNIITNIRGSWPTPQSSTTLQLAPGLVISSNKSNTQFCPTGATILATPETDGTLAPGTLRMSGNALLTGDVILGFGYQHPYHDAMYNVVAPLFYRYMTCTSGHMDKLRTAIQLASSWHHDIWPFTGGPTAFPNGFGGAVNFGTPGAIAHYATPYTDENGVTHAVGEQIDLNEFGNIYNSNPSGVLHAESGWRHNAWMTYIFTEWNQPLGCLIKYGVKQFVATAPGGVYTPWAGYPWTAPGALGPNTVFHTPSGPGGYDGGRQVFRSFREIDALFYMLSLPFDVRSNQNTIGYAPSPRIAANKAKYMEYFQKKYWDSTELWSQEYDAADPKNGFLKGLWGFSPKYVQYSAGNFTFQGAAGLGLVHPQGDRTVPITGPAGPITQNEPDYNKVPGTCPLFQLGPVMTSLSLMYCNILEDPRFLTKMGELAEWFADVQNSGTAFGLSATLTSGPATSRPSNPPAYLVPYRATDPSLLAAPPTNDASHGKTSWIFNFVNLDASGNPDGTLGQWRATHNNAIEQFGVNWWTVTNLLHLIAWGSSRNPSHTKLRNMTLGAASVYAMTLGVGHAPVPFNIKDIGETYHMAFPAAAWFANHSWGLVPEGNPDIPPPPQTITLTSPIPETIHTPLPITVVGGDQTVGNITTNTAKGFEMAWYQMVRDNSPTGCALGVMLLASVGLEDDEILRDKEFVSDFLSGSTNEATNTGYARKILVAADLAARIVDHTNNRQEFDLPDQIWTTIANDGTGLIGKLILYFRPAAGSADSACKVINFYDFAVTPDGSEVKAQINAAGAHRVS